METLTVQPEPSAVGVPHSSSSSRTEAKSEHESQFKIHAPEWTSSSTTLDSDTGNNTTGSSSSSTSVSSTGSSGGGYRSRQNGGGGNGNGTAGGNSGGSFYRPAHFHPSGRQNYNNYQNYGRQQSGGTHHHHQGYYNGGGGYYNNNRRYSKRPFNHPPPQTTTTNSVTPTPGTTDYFYSQQQHNYYMRNHHHTHHHQQPTTTGLPPPPLSHLNYGQPWARQPLPTELDYKFLGVVDTPVATSTPTAESAPTLTTVDGVILQFDKTVAPPSVVVLKEEELAWPLTTTTIVEKEPPLTTTTTAVTEMKPKAADVENHATTTVALGKNYCNNPYQSINPDELVESFKYYEEMKMPKTVVDEWEGLSTSIWKKFTANQQTLETFRKKMDLWKELFDVIQHSFPTYGLQIVGSTISGFGSNTSDIDMCLLIRRSEVDQRFEAIDYLHNLWAILKQIKCLDKIQVIYAKVPILKFHDQVRDLDIDLNCNNSVGIRNTHLLYNYSQCDWRVRPLVLVVKLWAQYHGINDAKNMTLSSYSLVLMVIHFLQTVSPPVLPCLQQCHNEKYLMMDLIKPPKEPRLDQHRFESKNLMSLGELMVNFLQYYAVTFDYNYAVSVRTGSVVSIKACQNNRARKNDSHQWKYFCIEEPFEYTNTARSVYDRDSFDRIRGVFFASWQRLAVCNDLDTIFTPIQISEARQIGTRLRENVILVYKKLNEIGEKSGIGVGTTTKCMTDRQMICAGGERASTR